jgi:hypothetical protein
MSLLMYAAHAVTTVIAQPPNIPNPGTGSPPPGAAQFLTILKWGAWLVFSCCVAGILIVCGKMALNHRRGMGGGEEGANLAWPLIAAIVGASASAIIGALI